MPGWLLENTIAAALLSIVAWLLCRAGRFSPSLNHALWLLVLIKLVAPPLLEWPWHVPATGMPATWFSHRDRPRDEHAADPIPAAIMAPIDPGLHEFAMWLEEVDHSRMGAGEWILIPSAPAGTAERPTTEPGGIERSAEAPETGGLNQADVEFLKRIALAVWMAGVLASAALQGIRLQRFRRLVADRLPVPIELVRRVRRLADQLGVRAPRIALGKQIRSPVIWGGVRTRLVWPAVLAHETDYSRWDGVIAHELAHIRRGDHWIGWLELAASCLHWWNPLFWYVRHQLREHSELACDAIVVNELPDARRLYAFSLIEVVSQVAPAAPAPVLGINSLARQAFERRLTMILTERVPARLSGTAFLTVCVLGLAVLPGWSQAQVPSSGTPAASDDPGPPSLPAPPDSLAVPAVNPIDQVPPTPDAANRPGQQALPALPDTPSPFTTRAQSIDVYRLTQSPADDNRIDSLEKKLQSLIDEVRSLRSQGSSQPKAPPAAIAVAPIATSVRSEVQTLTRATYRLPEPKAEALAAFLREHMKTPIEAKVDGESLVVTAPPHAQAAIEQFVALSEGVAPSIGFQYRMAVPAGERKATMIYQSSPLVPVQPPSATPPKR